MASSEIERPDYRKLVDDLPSLAGAFGEPLSPCAMDDVTRFIAVVDRVDRVIDAAGDRDRAVYRTSVLATLRGERGDPLDEQLHRVLARRGIVDRFVELTDAVLANAEQMRTTRDRRAYIAFAEREGALLVDLTVLLLGDRAGPRLVKFLYAVAGPANLWDKLVDARADRQAGEIAIPADAKLHVAIFASLAAGLPNVIRAHPEMRHLARWLVGWIKHTVRENR